MREILFRGKQSLAGNWCEGFLVKTGDHFRISTQNDMISFGVDPSTIGQYTGLKDKNGKLIFEGDIIGNPYNVVEYCLGAWTVNGDVPLAYYAKSHEVIGNIHDNPELLEESNES